MKTYEIIISAFASVVVEADTEEEAMRVACEGVDYGDFEMDEGRSEGEIPEDKLESAKRYCQKFFAEDEG